MPAAANCSGVDDAGERAAQHLAALAERRAHQREQLRRGRSSGGCAADDLDERRLDVGPGHEHRRPARRPTTAPSPSTRPSRSPRRTPACPASATSRSADLALHHHQHPLDRRHAVEQVAHERRGDVVRQVGDEHPAGRRRRAAPAQSSVIASASTTVHVGEVGDDVAQRGDEPAVDLDRGDRRRRSRRAPGSATRARRRSRPRGRRARRRRGGRCAAPCSGRRRSSARGRGAAPGRGSSSSSRDPRAASASSSACYRRISTWIGASVRSAICCERGRGQHELAVGGAVGARAVVHVDRAAVVDVDDRDARADRRTPLNVARVAASIELRRIRCAVRRARPARRRRADGDRRRRPGVGGAGRPSR